METISEVVKLQRHVEQLFDAASGTSVSHTKAALYKIADVRDQLVEVATALVEQGIMEGLSQAEIARCMDVPPSTLRGAKQEFSRA